MKIVQMKPSELIPYERNAKIHDEEQIKNVATSIRKYGFKQPIVVDKDNVIIIGHCRHLASQELGLDTVPVIVADDLTDEQVTELRIVDNKSAESEWDLSNLAIDIEGIDFSDYNFDFNIPENWFESRERNDNSGLQNESKEYQDFIEKFEEKRTTDDCYTPDVVYDAIAEYVAKYYKLNRKNFIRPFYPGGDYKNEKYKQDSVVVDNPPFSILSEILEYYINNNIKFFLFCPALTPFSSNAVKNACVLCVGATITYENKAKVSTSFITNMEQGIRLKSNSELYNRIKEANKEYEKEMTREIPKYTYPNEVVTASMVSKYSKYGIDFSVSVDSSYPIKELESQKDLNKAIYGGGFLISEKAAAEKAAAEKAAAEKAAAHKWELSDDEINIIKNLK